MCVSGSRCGRLCVWHERKFVVDNKYYIIGNLVFFVLFGLPL